MAPKSCPHWWDWDLDLTSHVVKRMQDRNFSEVELRRMLEEATSFRRDLVPGRWIIETRHRRRRWEIIVEPDEISEQLVVITAYAVSH